MGFIKNRLNRDNLVWFLLGFILPLIGLILFLLWKDSKPVDADGALIGALMGLLVGLVLSVILPMFLFGGFFLLLN